MYKIIISLIKMLILTSPIFKISYQLHFYVHCNSGWYLFFFSATFYIFIPIKTIKYIGLHQGEQIETQPKNIYPDCNFYSMILFIRILNFFSRFSPLSSPSYYICYYMNMHIFWQSLYNFGSCWNNIVFV